MEPHASEAQAVRPFLKTLRRENGESTDAIVEWLCTGACEPAVIIVHGPPATGKTALTQLLARLLCVYRGATAREFSIVCDGFQPGPEQKAHLQTLYDRNGTHCVLCAVFAPPSQSVVAESYPWARHIWYVGLPVRGGVDLAPVHAARSLATARLLLCWLRESWPTRFWGRVRALVKARSIAVWWHSLISYRYAPTFLDMAAELRSAAPSALIT